MPATPNQCLPGLIIGVMTREVEVLVRRYDRLPTYLIFYRIFTLTLTEAPILHGIFVYFWLNFYSFGFYEPHPPAGCFKESKSVKGKPGFGGILEGIWW